MFLSPSTGILLNDNMGDFAYENIANLYEVEPSKANFAKPGKRPLSSMCPTVVLDEYGDVVLVVGASGGTRITTSVAQVCKLKWSLLGWVDVSQFSCLPS